MASRQKTTKWHKPKTILRFPDLEHSKNAVVNSLAAVSSQEAFLRTASGSEFDAQNLPQHGDEGGQVLDDGIPDDVGGDVEVRAVEVSMNETVAHTDNIEPRNFMLQIFKIVGDS